MSDSGAILVDKILGSRQSEEGDVVTIGLVGGGAEHKFDFPPDLLGNLALTALRARSIWDANEEKRSPGKPGILRALPCDKWEIRATDDNKFLLFSFRVVGGTWVRFQISRQTAGPIRETLESVEGRSASPKPRRRQN